MRPDGKKTYINAQKTVQSASFYVHSVRNTSELIINVVTSLENDVF